VCDAADAVYRECRASERADPRGPSRKTVATSTSWKTGRGDTSMKADAVVCGAGIAGIAAADALVRDAGLDRVLIVDQGAPLSLTSDKSTECYRNWWPGPGDDMVALSSRSIGLMERLAADTGNAIRLDRRGYLYLSADATRAGEFLATARECETLGAGPLRIHDRGLGAYAPPGEDPAADSLTGADLLLDPGAIRRAFPYVCSDIRAALHVRRAGGLSAQQLGMVLLARARDGGARLARARVEAVDTGPGHVRSVRLRGDSGPIDVDTPRLVVAAGPYLADVAAMAGVDVPVVCERHVKLTFDDREGVLPREAPLSIWCDPTRLAWGAEEREALAADPQGAALLEPFPAGVHGRRVGAGHSLMLYWTYDCPVETPRFPVTWDAHYPEVLLRGMSVMVPGLRTYHTHMPNAFLDGGYYTKTAENRPLVGPTAVGGLYLCGAFSGFGIMTAMGAGELLAAHVRGAELPHYARAFALSRYQDPGYRSLIDDWPASGQI
jgi:glycine/D-amino acid oxidase-like deaminating enzyme